MKPTESEGQWVPLVVFVFGAGGALLLALLSRPTYALASLILTIAIAVARPATIILMAAACAPFIPFLRRISAGSAGYVENDPLILLPLALVGIAAIYAISQRPIPSSPASKMLGLALTLMVISALLPGPLGAAAKIYGLGVLGVGPLVAWLLVTDRIQIEWRVAEKVLIATSSIAAAYGVWQYYYLPSWDQAWMLTTQIASIGEPYPESFRLYATLEVQHIAALYIGFGLVALFWWAFGSSSTGSWMRFFFASPLLFLQSYALLLTGVRAALYSLPFAILVSMAVLPSRRGKGSLLGAAVLCVGMFVAMQTIGSGSKNAALDPARLLLSNPDQDVSLTSRRELLNQISNIAIRPFGLGPGSTGMASRLSGAVTRQLDNGILDVATQIGPLGAVLLFGVLIAAIIRSPRAIKIDPAFRGAAAICALALAFSPGGNAFVGSQALVLWIAVGTLLSASARLESAEATPSDYRSRIQLPTDRRLAQGRRYAANIRSSDF